MNRPRLRTRRYAGAASVGSTTRSTVPIFQWSEPRTTSPALGFAPAVLDAWGFAIVPRCGVMQPAKAATVTTPNRAATTRFVSGVVDGMVDWVRRWLVGSGEHMSQLRAFSMLHSCTPSPRPGAFAGRPASVDQVCTSSLGAVAEAVLDSKGDRRVLNDGGANDARGPSPLRVPS